MENFTKLLCNVADKKIYKSLPSLNKKNCIFILEVGQDVILNVQFCGPRMVQAFAFS
jgi:hypothetical protein